VQIGNDVGPLETENPLVSVLVPVFDAAEHLHECLDSVVHQTYRNIEILAIDDGSRDGSLAILRQFAAQDGRLRVLVNKRNCGVGDSVNQLWREAQGVYVVRVDADDICTPDRIERQAAFLRAQPDTVIVGGQVEIIDPDGRTIGIKRFPLAHDELRDMLFTAMPIQQAASMINRTLLPPSEVLYVHAERTAEEVDLYFRLLRYGKFANLDEVTYKYRMLDRSLSHQDAKATFWRTVAARRRAIRVHHYRPTPQAWMVHFLQIAAVSVLPRSLVMPVYDVLRPLALRLIGGAR